MPARSALGPDSMSSITRLETGPSEGQVRLWVKRGYLKPTRRTIPGHPGYYLSFDAQERFVAVVTARLQRVGIPSRKASNVARKCWDHRNGSHRVNLGDNIILTFTTQADGTSKS